MYFFPINSKNTRVYLNKRIQWSVDCLKIYDKLVQDYNYNTLHVNSKANIL